MTNMKLFKNGHKDISDNIGRIRSEITKQKISKSRRGKNIGENNYNWKGDKVGYFALHHWINRVKGKAKICEFCGKEEGRLHWANINHLYRRCLEEYISLCPKCHKQYDMQLN